MDSEKASFKVNDSFLDRQKHLYDQLDQVEKSLNKHVNHRDSHVPRLEDLSVNAHRRNKIKGFKGRESIFKRPDGPAPRANIRTIPDYRRNPTKWTCYSLDDVIDMSNETNTAAALSFLTEMKKRKNSEASEKSKVKDVLPIQAEMMETDKHEYLIEDQEESDKRLEKNDQHEKVFSFRKPKAKKQSSEKDSKAEFRGNKVIMPEYEIGSKKTSKKKKSQKNIAEKIDKKKEMKLDHLQDYKDD